jgi:hypothetical protein
MSDEHHTRAALENQAFALMGRLHVILRRQTGRVTDIEYMRIDPAYCRYLLKLASLSDNADLRDIGVKLEEIYFGPEGLFVKGEPRPLLARLTEQEASPKVPAAPATPAAPKTDDDIDRGYIGRLR